jgi:HD-like signal output (HDOD) protein
MPTGTELVSQIDRLATLPAVYFRVKRVIDDPNGSIGQLAAAMATDPAMTLRVLRVVNSPFYCFPGRIETVTRALNILGMQKVHDVVLAWAISSAFTGVRSAVLPMDAFWRASVARAIASRQLAQHARFVDAERLFVEGLLSHIGRLVMYVRVPELAREAMETSGRTGRPLHEVERQVVGCDYAEVGAALVSSWALPQAFEEPIRCQTRPCEAVSHLLEASILHVASTFADGVDAPAHNVCDPLTLKVLDLDESALVDLREHVSRELGSVVAAYFPNLAAA